jgi:hypothetical protein
MGILKTISEMGIDKLVIWGVLWLVVGVPTIALLVIAVVILGQGPAAITGETIGLICALTLGIPVFALFVTMVISICVGPFALLSSPWRGDRMPTAPKPQSRARNLSFGVVLLTIGIGITASVYIIPRITGLEGIPMLFGTLILFGGLGLIISYFVVSAIEKRQKEKNM